MPKIFSEEERSVIRASMLKIGAELLKQKGIRLVSVEEIAKRVHIAKGTFYSFYSSKEELLWDVIRLEKQRIADEILKIGVQEIDLKTKIRRILNEVYLKDGSIIFCLSELDTRSIARKLPPDVLPPSREKAADINRTFLTVCGRTAGDENMEVLTAMLEALQFARMNQLPQGASAKRLVLDILVEAIADYFCG